MDTHTITAAAAAFATMAAAAVLFAAIRGLIARGAPKFRAAAVVVWLAAVFGFVLAWFPGFFYGGYFGGAVLGAGARMVGVASILPVAVGIAIGMTAVLAALGAILPLIVTYLCFRPKPA